MFAIQNLNTGRENALVFCAGNYYVLESIDLSVDRVCSSSKLIVAYTVHCPLYHTHPYELRVQLSTAETDVSSVKSLLGLVTFKCLARCLYRAE